MKKRIKKNNLIEIFMKPEMRILPGQLAFFLCLALVPTISIIIFFVGLLDLPIEKLKVYYDLSFYKDFLTLLKPITLKPSLLMFIITLYISSNGMNSVIVTANDMYEIEQYNFLKTRLKALLMVAILILLFFSLFVIPTVLSFITKFIPNVPSYVLYLKYPLLFLIIFIFLKILYILAPNKKIESRSVNLGSLVCTLGWMIMINLYTYYFICFANYRAYYNALADVVSLMFLIYILAFIFVIGLALNYENSK